MTEFAIDGTAVHVSLCGTTEQPAICAEIAGENGLAVAFAPYSHRIPQGPVCCGRLRVRRAEHGEWEESGNYNSPDLEVSLPLHALPTDMAAHAATIAVRVAALPASQPAPKTGVDITDTSCRIIFVPKDGNDEDDMIEMGLDRDGVLTLREWMPWETHEPAPNVWYRYAAWRGPMVIATGLKAEAAEALAPGSDDEDRVQLFRDLFWEYGNQKISDPYLRGDEDDWLESRDLTWDAGSAEELSDLFRLFVWSDPAYADASWPLEFTLEAKTDEHPSRIRTFDWHPASGQPSSRLQSLYALAAAEHRFEGWDAEYNDGASGRRSGYSHYAHSVELELEAPSAQERLDAIRAVRNWLEPRVGSAEADRLCTAP